MIDALILLISQQVATPPPAAEVFACAFIARDSDDPMKAVVDLRAERRLGEAGESWLLDWPDGRSAVAKALDNKFVGSPTAIRWIDGSGAAQQAFILFGNVALPNKRKVMFLSLNKPSFWRAPGYVCSTSALQENR